jgi:hypothetical protein
VIAEDQIKTVGAGIDAVTDHVIVMVVTSSLAALRTLLRHTPTILVRLARLVLCVDTIARGAK